MATTDAQSLLRLEHRLATIAAVPGALVAAAAVAGLLGGAEVSRWLSSSIFLAFLLGYAMFTRAGRRSSAGSFGQGGLILLLLITLILQIMAMNEDAAYDLLEFLFMVGFAPGGAPDAPFFIIAGGWWISLMLCIAVAVLLRNLMLFVVLKRTSLDDSGG